MDKLQLLSDIKLAVQQNLVTKQEVIEAASEMQSDDALSKRMSLSEILYYLGGSIVFLGIIVLCYQNWDSFSSGLRIFIALGSMLACFVVGALLYRYENLKKISQAFFLIAGLLGPLGVGVTFKEMGFDLSSSSILALNYLILTAIFLGGFYFFRQTILLFFGIVFASAFFHLIIDVLVANNLTQDSYYKVLQYRFLVLGLAYILLGYYLAFTSQKILSGVMYAFGSLFFLGSAMTLGGWQPNQNAFWELIYPLLVFGIIFLSVYIKSKAFLVFGTIFLIVYILKLTAEYFTSGLGWPLALVIAGLAIIGIGYYAVKLNKKYFAATV